MAPSESQTLYAAAYGRIRGRFSRSESEEVKILDGGGIYKTTDDGQNWVKLTAGLPAKRVGRIELALSPANPKKIYALVERAPYEVNLDEGEIHQERRSGRTQTYPRTHA